MFDFFEFEKIVGDFVRLDLFHNLVPTVPEVDVVNHVEEGNGDDVFLVFDLPLGSEIFHELLEDFEGFLIGAAVEELVEI